MGMKRSRESNMHDGEGGGRNRIVGSVVEFQRSCASWIRDGEEGIERGAKAVTVEV